MDLVHDRSVGIDISKRDAKVCVRVPGTRAGTFTNTVTTWGATTSEVLRLCAYLEKEHVTVVTMESTSDYWKPFYYLMEDSLPVMLVNAKHARNIPGRKSDVSDCHWLAQLGAYGLLRASFVPPEPIRELRDLTRARTIATHDRTREIQRLEKFLESSGIKLPAVATDLMGVSSRAILDALVAGERDPNVLAALAKGRLKVNLPNLVEALVGRFGEHHAFMTRLHLQQIDTITDRISQYTTHIDEAMMPFRVIRESLSTIPGVSTLVADVIIAETGADMSVFPTAGHLASWAGVSPGSNESAGRVKSTKTMPGNKHLKGALGVAALSVSHSKNTYLAVKYRRIAARRGKMKAIVALEHTILTSVWNMLTTAEVFTDLGTDYYVRLDPEKAKKHAIRQLQTLGYEVTISPSVAA